LNPYAILAGLLALAWAGGALIRPGRQRMAGLSSGTEFLLMGILLGPLGLAAVSRPTLEALAPVTLVAASWLALLAGSQLGFANRRRVPAAHLLLGIALSLAVFAATALLAWWLVPLLLPLSGNERLLLAIGLGCAGCETARTKAILGAQRLAAGGPLADALANLAGSDDMVPLAGLALLFALSTPAENAAAHAPPLVALGVTLGLGVAAGALAGVLTRVEQRLTERWGILLGTGLMAIGLSAVLGLAAPAALAVMGVTLNLLARDGAALRGMLASTARPVLLPVVALAGAQLDLRDGLALWAVAALVPAMRLAIKLPAIALLRHHLTPPTLPGPWAGLALMACGPITVCVGAVVAVQFPGPIGRLVLAGCLAAIVIGELLGPPALRRELQRADEWPDDAAAAPGSATPGRS